MRQQELPEQALTTEEVAITVQTPEPPTDLETSHQQIEQWRYALAQYQQQSDTLGVLKS